jgi:hypothetical protein
MLSCPVAEVGERGRDEPREEAGVEHADEHGVDLPEVHSTSVTRGEKRLTRGRGEIPSIGTDFWSPAGVAPSSVPLCARAVLGVRGSGSPSVPSVMAALLPFSESFESLR